MAFNADAMVEALTAPEFTAGGRTFRGRILSIEEWMRLAVRESRLAVQYAELKAGVTKDGDPFTPATRRVKERAFVKAQRSFLHACLDAWFPRRWWQLVSPAWRAYQRLPDKVQAEALRSFSKAQADATPSPAPEPYDDGTNAPRRSDG